MEIELKQVTKTIRGATVVSNVTAHWTGGRVYGLCGCNGCGKTMLMRLVAGLIRPTGGEIWIDGRRLGRDMDFPDSIGMLLENPAFLDEHTGLQNLKLIACLKKTASEEDLKAALRRVNLNPEDRRKYRKYSLGMKQKLGIAAAIMERPELILLDEPTNALDADSLKMLKQIVFEERERGALLLIASHETHFLQAVADEILPMEAGRMVQKAGDGQ